MSHIIVIPYHCETEVDRYLKIGALLEAFSKQQCDYQFLLAASPQIKPSQRLSAFFESIGKTTSFQCPTRLVGYPFGATAMFWDCMDFIAKNYEDDGGFSLWLESDMVPVKSDWIDRLSAEWHDTNTPWLMMGCLVAEIYKRRAFRRPRLAVAEHINGGACYAKNFAKLMPLRSRIGNRFDLDIFPFVQEIGPFKHTEQLTFSMRDRLVEDIGDEQTAMVHGIMQDKELFVEACLSALAGKLPKKSQSILEPIQSACHRLNVRFFQRGEEFMLNSLMLQKDRRHSQDRKAA